MKPIIKVEHGMFGSSGAEYWSVLRELTLDDVEISIKATDYNSTVRVGAEIVLKPEVLMQMSNDTGETFNNLMFDVFGIHNWSPGMPARWEGLGVKKFRIMKTSPERMKAARKAKVEQKKQEILDDLGPVDIKAMLLRNTNDAIHATCIRHQQRAVAEAVEWCERGAADYAAANGATNTDELEGKLRRIEEAVTTYREDWRKLYDEIDAKRRQWVIDNIATLTENVAPAVVEAMLVQLERPTYRGAIPPGAFL